MTDRHPELTQVMGQDVPEAGTRLAALQHVRSCRACLQVLTAEEPERLFSLLGLEPIPALVLDRLSRNLEVALRHDVGRAARPSRSLAALAASLMLAGVFGAYLWKERLAPAVRPLGPARANASWSGPPRELATPAARIELLSSPGTAQVLDLTVGETKLVMIFDEALDL